MGYLIFSQAKVAKKKGTGIIDSLRRSVTCKQTNILAHNATRPEYEGDRRTPLATHNVFRQKAT